MNGQAERRLSDYITNQEREGIRGTYEALAHDVLYVGDVDLRHQTETDWANVQEIRRSVLHEVGWTQQTQLALTELQKIIESTNHTMLGKVYAGFASVDIVYQAGGILSNTFGKYLPAAIRKASTDPEKVLILAAHYSRFMALVMEHEQADGSGQQMLSDLYTKLLGRIDTPDAARKSMAVQVAANVFRSEIRQDAFGMRLPEAELESAYTEGYTQHEVEGQPIPHSIVYLASGRLVSWNKLKEATKSGIPGSGTPQQRIPELLVGVEVPVGVQTHEHTRTKLGYVSMRALRKPRHGQINWLASLQGEDAESFTNEKLFRYCSFDTLSFIAAVRIARELKTDDTPAGFSPSNILRKVEAVMARFQEVYPTVFGTKDKVKYDSILSVALQESQRIDGKINWELPQAARHLKSQITGLLVSGFRGDTVTWRDESELWELYLRYIVDNELTREDKMEMVGFLLKDPNHELWRKCDRTMNQKSVNYIVQWAHNRQPLPSAVADDLIECIPKYIVQRCETIRDMHIPLVPGARKLSSDDEE